MQTWFGVKQLNSHECVWGNLTCLLHLSCPSKTVHKESCQYQGQLQTLRNINQRQTKSLPRTLFPRLSSLSLFCLSLFLSFPLMVLSFFLFFLLYLPSKVHVWKHNDGALVVDSGNGEPLCAKPGYSCCHPGATGENVWVHVHQVWFPNVKATSTQGKSHPLPSKAARHEPHTTSHRVHPSCAPLFVVLSFFLALSFFGLCVTSFLFGKCKKSGGCGGEK